MKTKNYNIGKNLIALIIVALISTVSFATTKENPTSGKNAELEKSTFNVSESKAEAFTETLQNWMNKGSYWEKENSAEVSNSEFSNELSKWMSDGSYWSEPRGKEEVKKNVVSDLKSFMTSGSYWKSDNGSNKK